MNDKEFGKKIPNVEQQKLKKYKKTVYDTEISQTLVKDTQYCNVHNTYVNR